MKKLSDILLLAVVAVLSAACEIESVETIERGLIINAEISDIIDTKSCVENVLKSSWNFSETILVSVDNRKEIFVSGNSGEDATFTNFNMTSFPENSRLCALYTAFSKFDSNNTEFSLSGQSGRASDIKRFDIMSACGIVRAASADLCFNHEVAVIRLSNVSFPKSKDSKLCNLAIEGRGISSRVRIGISGYGLEIKPMTESPIIVAAPNFNEDVYVAFIPTEETREIRISASDSEGGDFFYTIENNTAFQAGQIYNVENITFEGGYRIGFTAGVNGWGK